MASRRNNKVLSTYCVSRGGGGREFIYTIINQVLISMYKIICRKKYTHKKYFPNGDNHDLFPLIASIT